MQLAQSEIKPIIYIMLNLEEPRKSAALPDYVYEKYHDCKYSRPESREKKRSVDGQTMRSQSRDCEDQITRDRNQPDDLTFVHATISNPS